jgi:hypothetical protein
MQATKKIKIATSGIAPSCDALRCMKVRPFKSSSRVPMKTYYHALPQTVVGPPNSRHVGEFQDAFDWVSDFNEASRGSLDCVVSAKRTPS